MSVDINFELLTPEIRRNIFSSINDGKTLAIVRTTCKEAKIYIDSQSPLIEEINDNAFSQFKLWQEQAIAEGVALEKENEKTYLAHCKKLKPSFRFKQISFKVILGITTGLLTAGLIALAFLVGNIALPLLGFALVAIPIFLGLLVFGTVKMNSNIDKQFSFYKFIPNEHEKIRLIKLFVDDSISAICANQSLKRLLHQASKLGFIKPETAKFLKGLIDEVNNKNRTAIQAQKDWETWKHQKKVIQKLPYLSRYRNG